MLARKGPPSGSTPASELRDRAADALREGQVEAALHCYRTLERQFDSDPTWSLRVAECYRRLERPDGEVSALMRAADRFERRGFCREAVALWSRIEALDPAHPGARLALQRLLRGRSLGLDRLQSKIPPPPRASQPPLLHSDVVPVGSNAHPPLPPDPRLPSFVPTPPLGGPPSPPRDDVSTPPLAGLPPAPQADAGASANGADRAQAAARYDAIAPSSARDSEPDFDRPSSPPVGFRPLPRRRKRSALDPPRPPSTSAFSLPPPPHRAPMIPRLAQLPPDQAVPTPRVPVPPAPCFSIAQPAAAPPTRSRTPERLLPMPIVAVEGAPIMVPEPVEFLEAELPLSLDEIDTAW